MRVLTTAFVLISGLTLNAMANSELDPISTEAPQGLVVRIASDGKREVYKASLSGGIVENDSNAAAIANAAVNEDNKVSSVEPAAELDDVTSDESWHWSWNSSYSYSSYYSYSYRYSGGCHDYYPSYSYYSGGYQYNYYYSSSYYGGYHGGHRYDDQRGSHYSRRHGGWRP